MAASAQPKTVTPDPTPIDSGADVYSLVNTHLWTLFADKLSGLAQMGAILLITRNTLTKSRAKGTPPPEWACLSLKEFASKCHCTREHASSMISDLEKRKIVQSISPAQARQAGLSVKSQERWYRLTTQNWKDAPKYEPPKPTLVKPEPEPAAAADPEPAAPPRQTCPETKNVIYDLVRIAGELIQAKEECRPFTLQPGAKAKPVKISEPAEEYLFKNEASIPIQVEESFASGRLSFVIRDEKAEVSEAGSKLQLNSNAAANGRNKGEVGVSSSLTAPANGNGRTKGEVGVSSSLTRRELIDTGLKQRKLFVNSKMLAVIDTNLGPASLEKFWVTLDEAIERAANKGKRFEEKWLPQAASDARVKWQKWDAAGRPEEDGPGGAVRMETEAERIERLVREMESEGRG